MNLIWVIILDVIASIIMFIIGRKSDAMSGEEIEVDNEARWRIWR